MDYIKITLNELINILNEYEIDMSTHTPLDNLAFANYIFNFYQLERSIQEDPHIKLEEVKNMTKKEMNEKMKAMEDVIIHQYIEMSS